MDDGAEHVGECDVSAAPPGRHGHATDLLGLDCARHGRVPEQPARDAESRDGAPQPLADELPAAGQDGEPGEHADEREAAAAERLSADDAPAGIGEACETDQRPCEQHASVRPRQAPVDPEGEQRQRAGNRPREHRRR